MEVDSTLPWVSAHKNYCQQHIQPWFMWPVCLIVVTSLFSPNWNVKPCRSAWWKFNLCFSSRYIHSSSFWGVFLLLLCLLPDEHGRRQDVLQGATHAKRGGGGIHLGGQQGGLRRQQFPDSTPVAAAGRPGLCRADEWQAAMWEYPGPKHLLWLTGLPLDGLILVFFSVA